MPDENPVFHFRARFRARALFVQKSLLRAGLVLSAAGLGGTLLANTTERLHTLLLLAVAGGALSLLSSVAWGIFWRVHIRNDFRRTFGSSV